MSVNIDTPLIAALKIEVEKVVGTISGHDKFVKLTELIESKCKEHISVTTLERLWGYSTRSANRISERILDIIARFVDTKNWDDFCAIQNVNIESVLFEGDDIINCDNLKINSSLKFEIKAKQFYAASQRVL